MYKGGWIVNKLSIRSTLKLNHKLLLLVQKMFKYLRFKLEYYPISLYKALLLQLKIDTTYRSRFKLPLIFPLDESQSLRKQLARLGRPVTSSIKDIPPAQHMRLN